MSKHRYTLNYFTNSPLEEKNTKRNTCNDVCASKYSNLVNPIHPRLVLRGPRDYSCVPLHRNLYLYFCVENELNKTEPR